MLAAVCWQLTLVQNTVLAQRTCLPTLDSLLRTLQPYSLHSVTMGQSPIVTNYLAPSPTSNSFFL